MYSYWSTAIILFTNIYKKNEILIDLSTFNKNPGKIWFTSFAFIVKVTAPSTPWPDLALVHFQLHGYLQRVIKKFVPYMDGSLVNYHRRSV